MAKCEVCVCNNKQTHISFQTEPSFGLEWLASSRVPWLTDKSTNLEFQFLSHTHTQNQEQPWTKQ